MEDYSYKFIDKIEVKLVLLYTVLQAREIAKCPFIAKQFLSDFTMQHINADYIDVHECMDLLVKDGQFLMFTDNHKDVYQITENGEFIVSQFFNKLPISVRDEIDESIYNDLREYKDKEAIVTDYWAENEKCYTASLKIYDEKMLSLQLAVSFPGKTEAQIIHKKFQEDPAYFYKKINEICAEVIDKENERKKP